MNEIPLGKTEMIPMYFTFDELLHVLIVLDEHHPREDEEDIHEMVFGLVSAKVNHVQAEKAEETQRIHDAYVDRELSLRAAFSYNSGYSSPNHITVGGYLS